jgi:hypothetical protein
MKTMAHPPPVLHSLIYKSTAARPLHRDDLDRLLRTARVRNARDDITGLLLYAMGNFMQYLEGPLENLQSVFEVIKQSPLHRDIVEVDIRRIDVREYPAWSMAFMADSGHGPALEVGEDPVDYSQANSYLAKFWSSAEN